MRTIEWTGKFKRDYKREKKGQHRVTLDDDLFPVVNCLANDEPLEPRHRDHALTGDWRDHRDCHIKPDLERRAEKWMPVFCKNDAKTNTPERRAIPVNRSPLWC